MESLMLEVERKNRREVVKGFDLIHIKTFISTEKYEFCPFFLLHFQMKN